MSETAAIPPGYQPLFLATASCEIFNLRPGVDVNAETPMKMIPKTDILADIDTRRAVSDFQPFKSVISAYPNESLLVFFDAEWKYGQNFYIITSAEAAESILHPVNKEASEEKEGETQKSLKGARAARQPWVSMGSEKEVDEEIIVKNRPLILVHVSKNKTDLGKGLVLVDSVEGSVTEYRPPADSTVSELKRMELNAGIQVIPTLADKSIQAAPGHVLNEATQYEPISFTDREKDDIFSLDSFQEFVTQSYSRFEYALVENQVIDSFKDHYANLNSEELAFEENNRITLQEYQSFTELKYSKNKSISWIQWHPTIKTIIAISCTNRSTFDEKIDSRLLGNSRNSLVIFWSFFDPIRPQLFLDAPDDVQCFTFHPNNPNIVVAGCANGQMVIWDISEYGDRLKNSNKISENQGIKLKADEFFSAKNNEIPFVNCVAVSAIESSHRNLVTDMHWIPNSLELGNHGLLQPSSDREKSTLISVSLDGNLMFWELRGSGENWEALNLNWSPLIKTSAVSPDGTHDYGCTRINLRLNAASNKRDSTSDLTTAAAAPDKGSLSTKFYGGCDDGEVIYADWYSERTDGVKTEFIYNNHFGPVVDVDRSPFFSDLVLTAGGWSFHILKEGVTIGPILSSESYAISISAAKWSNTRPGVFYIARADGVLEIWDLLDKSSAPAATQTISSNPISFLASLPDRSRNRHQMLAVGDDCGTLYVMEVPRSLSKPIKNETTIVSSFFDREVQRLNGLLPDAAKSSKNGGKNDVVNKAVAPVVAAAPTKRDLRADAAEIESIEKQFITMEKLLVI